MYIKSAAGATGRARKVWPSNCNKNPDWSWLCYLFGQRPAAHRSAELVRASLADLRIEEPATGQTPFTSPLQALLHNAHLQDLFNLL
jgi:hypothetical protein